MRGSALTAAIPTVASATATPQQTTSSGGGGSGGVTKVAAGTNVSVASPTGPTATVSVPTFPWADLTGVPSTFPPSTIHPSTGVGTVNWNSRYYVEDYASLQLACNAAAAANGVLFLPPGQTAVPAGGLVLTNFQGAFAIRGYGSKVSVLIQNSTGTSANGIYFDMSQAGTPVNNTVDLADFGIASTQAGSTNATSSATALTITYGTTPIGSSSNQQGSILHNIQVWGGGWVNGFAFIGCWNLRTTSLFAFGNSTYWNTGAGSGSGSGVHFAYGVNDQMTATVSNYWANGCLMDHGSFGTGYGPQGIVLNGWQSVQTPVGIFINGVSGDFIDLIEIANWMIDNGGGGGAAGVAIKANYAEHVFIHHGFSAQKGPGSGTLYHVILNNCTNGNVDHNGLDEQSNYTTYYGVYLQGSTTGFSVDHNTFTQGIDDSTTSANTHDHNGNCTWVAGSGNNNMGLAVNVVAGTYVHGATNTATVQISP